MALPRPARTPPKRAPVSINGDGLGHPDPWTDAPSDRLPQRFQATATHRLESPEPAEAAVRTRVPHALFGVLLFGAFGYGIGWLVAYYGWLPGVFRASDIGFPALMFATLRGVAKIAERGIAHPVHAKAAAGVGRAGAWAISVYWLGTFTNVLQLGIGLALGILVYQGYATRTRLAKAGFPGFGPAFAPMVATVLVYAGYQLARLALGPIPGFDVVSAAAAFVAAIIILRTTRARVLQVADLRPEPQASGAHAGASTRERRVLVGLVVGYLFFRLFISDVIPYGPIVEWFLVCIGVLFFAIIAADRIGTVPTRRSLPAADKRTHVQKVSSLPDRQLAETQEHLTRFIQHGEDVDWLHEHFTAVLHEAGYARADVTARVAPLVQGSDRRGRGHAPAETMSIEARSRIVHDLVHALRTRRVPTGTLKADPPVQTTARRRAAPGT